MGYLHCHTKGCDWEQDNFYCKKYNPLTKIISDIKWLWKPKIIKWDACFEESMGKDIQEYTGIKIKFKNNTCFSWSWLIVVIVKDIKIMLNMKWWTYKSYLKDKKRGKAKCPKCGLVNFDID